MGAKADSIRTFDTQEIEACGLDGMDALFVISDRM